MHRRHGSALRRNSTKASVDILLQRLRGERNLDAEGSKQCMAPRCLKMLPRSAFVSPDSGSTRQWLSSERRCLRCLELDKQTRKEESRQRTCNGHYCKGARQPRTAFSYGGGRHIGDGDKCMRCNAYDTSAAGTFAAKF
eukprot:gene4195-2480_t